MPKKKVFLDECVEFDLAKVFGPKARIFTAKSMGITGVDDTCVIERAVQEKCLIVTINKDFISYYKSHPLRRKKGFFYGLIFLNSSKRFSRSEQLKKALKEIDWWGTRRHDDFIVVHADGGTSHERLCHPECRAEYAREEEEYLNR